MVISRGVSSVFEMYTSGDVARGRLRYLQPFIVRARRFL